MSPRPRTNGGVRGVVEPSHPRDLDRFEAGLEDLIGKPSRLRPFVCEGSPLDCEVFVVGHNPATTMESDFWEFWGHGYGFDKAGWFEAYKRERAARPMKPGRTRRNAVSPTRRRIDLLVAAAAPVRCLETNVWAAPSPSLADLEALEQHSAVLEYLLETIKPRLIVTHGREAATTVFDVGTPVPVLAVNHLSYQTSDARAQELGAEVRNRVEQD